MSHNANIKTESRPEAAPTPVERLTTIERDLANLNELLEHLWLERHMLASALSEVRVVRRHIEIVKRRLVGAEGGGQ